MNVVFFLDNALHYADPPGQGPMQPALGDPALAGALD